MKRLLLAAACCAALVAYGARAQTADELKAHANLTSTGRPLWFAGSTLAFSADSSAFVVRTPWGREVQLDLNRGAIHAQ